MFTIETTGSVEVGSQRMADVEKEQERKGNQINSRHKGHSRSSAFSQGRVPMFRVNQSMIFSGFPSLLSYVMTRQLGEKPPTTFTISPN